MLRNGKQVVRTSVLSKRWRFLWTSVPVSLNFNFPLSESKETTLDYLASIHRELYYWRYCRKIREFRVWGLRYDECYAKDVDLWVHFATKIANVEEFVLGFSTTHLRIRYDVPQYVYKNELLRKLTLWHCQLNPSGSIKWSNLVSLLIGYVEFTDGVMEKLLSGCPNLECLDLERVLGIHPLEISSTKLKILSINDYYDEYHDNWLEIFAPYIQDLHISGLCSEIRVKQRNVASLVRAMLHVEFDFGDRNLEKESSYLKELLLSVAHVENLELGNWCIECLSILELKGWQFPPSSWKILNLCVALEQLDFPGICNFFQSSLNLETLVIDWYDSGPNKLLSKFTNEDEQAKRFETHNFNGSFPYLKTIKILNFYGSVLPLVKYFLKHAIVLEKFVIVAAFKEEESDVSPDYGTMALEFLSLPRSSPHASVIFSY